MLSLLDKILRDSALSAELLAIGVHISNSNHFRDSDQLVVVVCALEERLFIEDHAS